LLVPVAAGIAAGAALLTAANRALAQVLYGVSSYDPLTLVGASLLFLAVAAAAAVLPSRAAARVNPVLALRQ
jgi:ABC-type antimicrobial peptide transport system permease subunit